MTAALLIGAAEKRETDSPAAVLAQREMEKRRSPLV